MTGTRSDHVEPQDEWLVAELARLAASSTGFDPEAIRPRAVERVLDALLSSGWTREDIVHRMERDDRELVRALRQVVVVGETFFFRQPEHFKYIATTFVPDRLAARVETIRAWSAGCATGEEAYSLAATLRGALPASSGVRIDVLGTDLLERNVEIAERGVYQARALREAGPILHHTFQNLGSPELEVADSLRRTVRFATHNLLEPAPREEEEGYHLILCRNVLVYFSLAAIRRVSRHLASALAPGGVLILGPMDVVHTPPGLERVGLPELQLFRRNAPAPPRSERWSPPPPPASSTGGDHRRSGSRAPGAGEAVPEEPVALHLRALAHLELGERAEAERILTELVARAPDYVPGLMERALLHMRNGERKAAVRLMEEVLRQTDDLPPDGSLAGPEPLPVRFYTDSVRAFLERHG